MKEKFNSLRNRITMALMNEKGMEIIQALVLVVVAVVLGTTFMDTMDGTITTQLGTVSTKIASLFAD